MQSKSLLIAIAAFAVTTTGAQAFIGERYVNQLGLSTEQVSAFNRARDLRKSGQIDKARDILLQAGVNEETMDSLRKASHASNDAIHKAVLAADFMAFKSAIAGTPLDDIIINEDDFKLFKQAHDLKYEGKYEEANVIFDDLGVLAHQNGKHFMSSGHRFLELTTEQRDALNVARQANDHHTVQAILEEAGINKKLHGVNGLIRGDRNHWQ